MTTDIATGGGFMGVESADSSDLMMRTLVTTTGQIIKKIARLTSEAPSSLCCDTRLR